MWIRSQDKSILVQTKRIIANNRCIINHVLHQSDVDDYDILGKYETQERALEVLDEIQLRIIRGTTFDEIKTGGVKTIRDFVFQMPEK